MFGIGYNILYYIIFYVSCECSCELEEKRVRLEEEWKKRQRECGVDCASFSGGGRGRVAPMGVGFGRFCIRAKRWIFWVWELKFFVAFLCSSIALSALYLLRVKRYCGCGFIYIVGAICAM